MPDAIRLSVASEDETWASLQSILNNEIDFDAIEIDFSAANWAKFFLILRGEKFDQSLTAEAMRGLVEYHNAMYRSIALMLHKSHKITTLTDLERSRYELVFKIRKGSSEVEAEGEKSLFDLLGGAVKKMGRREAFIILLVLVLGYYGKDIALKYIDAGTEIAKTETERQRNKEEEDQNEKIIDLAKSVIERDKGRDAIINKALEQSERAAEVLKDSNKAFQSVMRGAANSDSLNLQGVEIPAIVIEEYNRISRRSAQQVTIDGNFRIISVHSQGEKTFRVVLREDDALTSFSAIIKDEKETERFQRVLQKAEWGKTSVRLKIRARKLGVQYLDAEIVKASTIRSKDR